MKRSEEQDAIHKFLSRAGAKGGRSRARLYSREQLQAWARLGGRPRKLPAEIKALSIGQPWASLVAIGAKELETRGWSTAYRGPLAIHASKTFPAQAREECLLEPFVSSLEWAGLGPETLPRGEVVAIGWLEDCLDARTARKLIKHGVFRRRELAFGDFKPGRFVLVLKRMRVLPKPIPATGKLGLWDWKAARSTTV
jgi:hypothetical protein